MPCTLIFKREREIYLQTPVLPIKYSLETEKKSHLVAANKKSWSFVFFSDSKLKTCHSKGYKIKG